MFRHPAVRPASDLIGGRPRAQRTGQPRLDARLAAGAHAGELVEVSGAASSGKASVALASCLPPLAAGRSVCWIDAGDGFCPLAALEAGHPLARLWVLRAAGGDAALRGAHLLLGCPGAVALIVVDLPRGFRPPELALRKLQRLAERAAAGLWFVTDRPAAAPSLGAAVGLRLHVRRRLRPGAAPAVSIEVLRQQGGAPQPELEEPTGGPDRVRLDSTL
jgi:hypothetical protein